MTQTQTNDKLVLISGKSSTGKSRSLRNIKNPEGVLYLNCESGKKLPFKSQFDEKTIVDPFQVIQAFSHAAANPDKYHTIIVDSLTYLMEMFESKYIYKSANGQQAWMDFQQFFKTLMQEHVATSTCNVIFTAHTYSVLNANEGVFETSVPVKGALAKNGVESYFTQVISTKKLSLKELADYKNDLLDITERDQALGLKYVFQTQITRDTIHERIRGPEDLFSDQETFIDNDIQKVIDRLNEYYN